MTAIDRLEVGVYQIPTDAPEADGTLSWSSTTAVVVEAHAGGEAGLGYTYGTAACARVIGDLLQPEVIGRDPVDVPAAWTAMVRAIRNHGRPGVVSMSIAAVDTALWDLKARLLGVPLARLLGLVREAVPVYGSGGFTSYGDERLAEQLSEWVHGRGIPRVKMKVGSHPERDPDRVYLARKAIGDAAELFVDANGAYSVKQAVRLAREFSTAGVTWFEEPVSSDDLDGLRTVREAIDAEVTAGEYGYDLAYFGRMCRAEAVDVLQIDVSRCGGITEFFRAAALAAGFGLQVSGHCAQSLHAHPACAAPNLRHLEYFHDHARVERLLFDGVLDPAGGVLTPDLGREGNGLTLKRADAARYAARAAG